MAKILVASDTHGNKEQLKNLLLEGDFTHLIFCGDMLKDLDDVNFENVIKVKGNWDEWVIDHKNKLEEVVEIEGVKILKDNDLYGAIIGKAYYTKAVSLKEAIEVANDN